jgi:hypothetical protein
MGFVDKVKASVKSGAEQAATRAQVEFERLQKKRELTQAYTDLGEKAFELADRGALAHDDLNALLERIRNLNAELAAIGAEDSSPSEPPPTG